MGAKIEGLDDLVAVLERAFAGPEIGKIVTRGAFNIKKDWRQRWSGMKSLPRLPYSITYDVEYKVLGQTVAAEIGPDLNKRQGPLGGIIEDGSPTSAPHPGGLPALAAEEPKFLEQLEKAAVRQLGG
jgi:hypothetical protein